MDSQLRAHQDMMLAMLGEIDRICEKHGIGYALFAGTALGAVRHKGFIPWDDDLDVIMLRADYKRFLEVAPQELDAHDYFLQKEFSEHWPCFFSKLRRNNTACIERYIPKDPLTHQGVYVDIFPCDNLSDNRIVQRMQFAAAKVVLAKALDARGYMTGNWAKRAFMVACRVVPQGLALRLAKLEGATGTRNVHTFFGASRKFARAVYPRAWFAETVRMPFEGGSFPVSVFADELLTTLYGDWRTPQPEADRNTKVHAEIVDLEHSYEDYAGIQKTMTFDTYTRSMR